MSDSDRVAATVVVSYSPAADEVREAVGELSYRRAHEGRGTPGEQWAEFVSRGCGSRAEVTLQVERVESGSRIGEDTALEFVPQ